jgi:hypothetical protein
MGILDTITGGLFQAGGSLISSGGQQLLSPITSALGLNTNAKSATYPADFVKPELRPEYLVTIVRSGPTDDTQTDPNRGITISGSLPDELSYDFRSEWSQPFSDNGLASAANVLGTLLGKKFVTQGMSTQFWTGSSPVTFNLPITFVADTGPVNLIETLVDIYTLVLPSRDAAGFFTAPGPKMKLAQDLTNSLTAIGSSIENFLNPTTIVQNALGFLPSYDAESVFNYQAISGAATPPNSVPKTAGATTAIKEGLSALQKSFSFDGEISLIIGQYLLIPSVVVTGVSNNFKVLMTRDNIPVSITVTLEIATHNNPTIEDVKSWFLVSGPTPLKQNQANLSGGFGSLFGNSSVASAASNVMNTLSGLA